MTARFVPKSFAFVLIFVAMTSAAFAEQWRIAQSIGQMWLGLEKAQPASLSVGAEVPDGATILVGATGRALLVRGKQTMMVGPNSVVTLPAQNHGRTTVLQRSGEVVFNVDRRDVRHFAVETPFLAAVVKGTMFQVHVSSTKASVQVVRGLVEVSSPRSGQVADVPAGQTATVSGRTANLSVAAAFGSAATVEQGKARAPAIAPLNAKSVRAIARNLNLAAVVSQMPGLAGISANTGLADATGTGISGALGDIGGAVGGIGEGIGGAVGGAVGGVGDGVGGAVGGVGDGIGGAVGGLL